VEAMAEGARLLVLDNCEQVVDAVAELVQTLLERCAGLRVLTTSRELLGLGCETVIPVSPLTTPSRDRSQPVIKVSRFDAVALFAERAASAVPGFALTDDNTATIAKICARLDGLPAGNRAGSGPHPSPVTRADPAAPDRASRPADVEQSRCAAPTADAEVEHRVGATTCAPPRNNSCGAGWRCSPGASTSTTSSTSAGRTVPGTCSTSWRRWWDKSIIVRETPAAELATGCSTRSVATAANGWTRPRPT
ncbi:hypothetical protein GS506_07790, partial [Rhodococcus hoagii]|nr:hypothetical protein [Prescottella equi]